MKLTVIFSLLILTCGLLIFQNCGSSFSTSGQRQNGTFNSLADCDGPLSQAFLRGYYPLVRRIGCNQCHSAGQAKADAAFADNDPMAALAVFKRITADNINARFAQGHNSATLGYSTTDQTLTQQLGTLLTEWKQISGACKLGQTSVKTGNGKTQIFDPAGLDDPNHLKCGLGDPLKTDHLNFGTVEFDASLNRPDLAGVKIKIQVQANTPATIGGNICAHQGYLAGNLTITTTKALYLKGARILLNGESYNVNTFLVERMIPANSTDYKIIQSPSGGFAIYDNGSCRNIDQWSVSIDTLYEMPLSQ